MNSDYKKWYKKWWIWLIIGFALFAWIGSSNSGSSSKRGPVNGIEGLRYQVNKAEKKDGVGDYKVKVEGQDTSKPYTANIFLNKADGYTYDTAKSNAITAVEGIKKMHYKDFSAIGIIFTTTMLDNYGGKHKNIKVLKYDLKKKTIEQIHPANISDLKPVADDFWRRPLEND